ncbi:unnamed protein product, partial [marine sediment metagenome]
MVESGENFEQYERRQRKAVAEWFATYTPNYLPAVAFRRGISSLFVSFEYALYIRRPGITGVNNDAITQRECLPLGQFKTVTFEPV